MPQASSLAANLIPQKSFKTIFFYLYFQNNNNSKKIKKNEKYNTFNNGNNLGNFAWFSDNKSYKVGTKKANTLGIYDMSGNVCEWCLDWYSETYYTTNAVTNPVNLTVDSYRVLRGGGYYNKAGNCRSTNRNFDYANSNSINYGFRIVCL